MPCFVCTTSLACLGISGVLSHRLFFIQGEHHLNGPWYLATWMAALLVIITILLFSDNYNGAFESVVLVQFTFFGPLFTSILVYRIFQHPLRHFDGPRLASVSKLWHLAYMFKSSNHLFLHGLVEKYGNFVRTSRSFLTPRPHNPRSLILH